MPSEKKNKKQKGNVKEAASTDQLRPLSYYVSDRLELTKQLFSCLKNKQIKQRLPLNLQNKSIERIQQICLDEILGISSKRLVSIINNTRCPENTDSDDSEVEQVDEHISLEEISSDSEAEGVQKKAKESAEKKTEAATKKPKSAKEMTMLELLELQARARAIRSQLALEPVTKIELDSDDEGGEGDANNRDVGPSSKAVSNDKNNVKEMSKKPETITKAPEPIIPHQIIRRAVNPLPPPAPNPVPSSKPLKLKRNYKTQAKENSNSSTLISTKEQTPPPKADEPEKNGDVEDERCSSPDVINMDPSPETFFISDSEDDEPPLKKIPEKKELAPVKESTSEIKEPEEPQQPEDGELSNTSSREVEGIVEEEKSILAPALDDANDNAMNDDDVVHLMSDTEIELHHQSDKEDDELEVPVKVETQKKSTESPKTLEVKATQQEEQHQQNFMSDDDVVEIHNSSDDEMMNESDDKSSELAKSSQTWEERWLSSSKTQNILKTTQLASKVRVNMLKTKKSQKASEKKKVDSEKAIKEKVSSLEEGSMKQFKIIKDNSNSSI